MPQIPIQRAILDGFHHVIGFDGGFAGEVGDGAADFQNSFILLMVLQKSFPELDDGY